MTHRIGIMHRDVLSLFSDRGGGDGALERTPVLSDRRDGCNGNEAIERLQSEPILADSLAAAATRKLFEER